jgi:hypothetical protein
VNFTALIILGAGSRRSDAFFLRIGEEAAGARVHRCDEHDSGGIIDRAEGAGDGDVAVFQRLAHDLEHVAPEFRQFVKKQDTVTALPDRPILVLKGSVRSPAIQITRPGID